MPDPPTKLKKKKKKKALELEEGFPPPLWLRCSSNAGFVSGEAKLSLSLSTVAVWLLGFWEERRCKEAL